MKIEFSKEEIVDMLLAKANYMVGEVGDLAVFNEVKFDARYSDLNSATVSFKEEVQDGTEVA